MEFLDVLLSKLTEILEQTPAGLILEILAALAVAMIVMQFVKPIVKQLWPKSISAKVWRRSLFAVMAYVAGFQSANTFITDPGTMASFIGFVNPALYLAMVKWATVYNKVWLLAVLKGRQIQRNPDGTLTMEETQQFHVDDHK